MLGAPAGQRQPRTAVRCADGVAAGVAVLPIGQHQDGGGHAEHRDRDATPDPGPEHSRQTPLPCQEGTSDDRGEEHQRHQSAHRVENGGVERGGCVEVTRCPSHDLGDDQHQLQGQCQRGHPGDQPDQPPVPLHQGQQPGQGGPVDRYRDRELGRLQPRGRSGDGATVRHQPHDRHEQGHAAQSGDQQQDADPRAARPGQPTQP